MLIDKKIFFEIKKGRYTVGLDEDSIVKLNPSIYDSPIKTEFLYNSFPMHDVILNGALISRKLVTLSDFKRFIEDTDYKTEAEDDQWGWVWEGRWEKKAQVSWETPFGNVSDEIYSKNEDTIPVMQVSFNDAIEYCRWLSRVTGENIRLPYEAEWEILSSEFASVDLNMNDIPIPGNSREFIEQLLMIIRKDSSRHPSGLIWEWTMNWFNAYPGGRKNKEFGEVYKVLKGGSLMSHEIQKRGEYRFRRCPTARSPYYGFRVGMEN